MTLARVVTFEDTNTANIERIKASIASGEPPEGMPPSELVLLHDPATGTALAIVIVETDDDYRRVDELLGSVPADEAAGRRTSVTRYEVAARASTS